ncbi:hypothetical protein DAPPUDRAFT_237019 [Daphnia pulex]|uniref:Uncharacterized protein n=1 Tax=Daphnia pulex TaxID=6669 RepID=E9G2J4_DAPPU|nr:hypothetical protein DAPPUDRAFT_237019 [Daphnia pulex]|eukprot:EFX86263.1 hypothetical protein DAPPUDRAFT_237019 [Daphnia pulex]
MRRLQQEPGVVEGQNQTQQTSFSRLSRCQLFSNASHYFIIRVCQHVAKTTNDEETSSSRDTLVTTLLLRKDLRSKMILALMACNPKL